MLDKLSLKTIFSLSIMAALAGTIVIQQAARENDQKKLSQIINVPSAALDAARHVCEREGGLHSIVNNQILCLNTQDSAESLSIEDAKVIYHFNAKYAESVTLGDVIEGS